MPCRGAPELRPRVGNEDISAGELFSLTATRTHRSPPRSLKDAPGMFSSNEASGGGVKLHRTAKRQNLAANIMLATGATVVTFTPGRSNEGECLRRTSRDVRGLKRTKGNDSRISHVITTVE